MSCRWYIRRSFCATDSPSAVCRNAASGSRRHFLPKSLYFSQRNSELLTLDLLLSTANNSCRWTAVFHREPHPRPRWPESYRRRCRGLLRTRRYGGELSYRSTRLLSEANHTLLHAAKVYTFRWIPAPRSAALYLQLLPTASHTLVHAAWCNYVGLVCSVPYGSTFVCISTSELPAQMITKVVYAPGGVADSAAPGCSHHHRRSPRLYYGCCYPALDSAASQGGPLCSHLPVVRCRSWSRRSSVKDSGVLRTAAMATVDLQIMTHSVSRK